MGKNDPHPLGTPAAQDPAGFFDEAPAGFVIADHGGVVLWANPQIAAWLGLRAQDMVGRRFSDFLTVSGRIYVETHLAPLLRMQGAYEEVALELLPAAGPRIPALVNARERPGTGDEPPITLMVILKSAVRRRYESDLLAARNELRETNAHLTQRVQAEVGERLSAEGRYHAERETAQLREQFIAVLGHDLRNPLAGISGGLNMLAKRLSDDHSRRVLDLMHESVDRMSGLVADLMDFARGRMGGGLSLHREAVDLDAALRHVCAEIAAAHPDRDIRVHIDLPRPVTCDRARIAQLLSNLVGNAIAHGDRAGPVWITGSSHDSILEISVSNTGTPIPGEMLDQLFQPFLRSHTSRQRSGLGLGLYICSEIARAHGGQLQVFSDACETRFVFTLPLD